MLTDSLSSVYDSTWGSSFFNEARAQYLKDREPGAANSANPETQVFQSGIPIHWGYVGLSADSDPSKGRYWLANALTPFVGDANARTPEFKAFLVNLEKI